MIVREYVIMAAQGMHARPATMLVKAVKSFKSVVSIKKGDKTVRLNSLLNVLSLTIKGGETVSVIIEGEDEANAACIMDLFFTEQLKNL